MNSWRQPIHQNTRTHSQRVRCALRMKHIRLSCRSPCSSRHTQHMPCHPQRTSRVNTHHTQPLTAPTLLRTHRTLHQLSAHRTQAHAGGMHRCSKCTALQTRTLPRPSDSCNLRHLMCFIAHHPHSFTNTAVVLDCRMRGKCTMCGWGTLQSTSGSCCSGSKCCLGWMTLNRRFIISQCANLIDVIVHSASGIAVSPLVSRLQCGHVASVSITQTGIPAPCSSRVLREALSHGCC